MTLQITSQPGWNANNAHYLAVMSALAYDQSTLACAETDTQVLIEEAPDYIAIAFRGTSSLRDFLTDADCARKTLPHTGDNKVKVHEGFFTAWESIFGLLKKRLDFTAKPLFITGHSLGGALALICGVELVQRNYNVHSVYTFGQPRVGNGAFADLAARRLGDRYQRVVYENDLVARIPHLPSLFDWYCHAGDEVLLKECSYGAVLNPSFRQLLWLELASAWRALFLKRGEILENALEDHHIHNYVRRLK